MAYYKEKIVRIVNKFVMKCNECNPIYTVDFIKNLQNKILANLAGFSNTENRNLRFELGYKFNTIAYANLVYYNNILDKMINCDDCYNCEQIESVVTKAQNTLNRLNG